MSTLDIYPRPMSHSKPGLRHLALLGPLGSSKGRPAHGEFQSSMNLNYCCKLGGRGETSVQQHDSCEPSFCPSRALCWRLCLSSFPGYLSSLDCSEALLEMLVTEEVPLDLCEHKLGVPRTSALVQHLATGNRSWTMQVTRFLQS